MFFAGARDKCEEVCFEETCLRGLVVLRSRASPERVAVSFSFSFSVLLISLPQHRQAVSWECACSSAQAPAVQASA